MDKEKTIPKLRTFFRVSTAAFAFARTVQEQFSNTRIPMSVMESLHLKALEEVEKEKPNLCIIDSYLKDMQNLAEKNEKSNL